MLKKRLTAVLVLGIAALFWWLLTRQLDPHERLIYPAPAGVTRVLIAHWTNILEFAVTTWYRVLVGLFLGGLIGFATGLLMSASRTIEALLDPFIELLRPVPPIALTPFFILWFGLGDFGQLLLVGLGCFMVVVVSTVVAAKNIPPVLVMAATSLGASTKGLYRGVYIPAILPALMSAVRVAAATGFGLTVAAEYLGAQGGLGYLIRNARTTLETDSILLAAAILGLESLITDYSLRRLGRWLTRWLPRIED
jgi:ABC-type nitrate/sulfonate/bicarbonate transport system permease component